MSQRYKLIVFDWQGTLGTMNGLYDNVKSILEILQAEGYLLAVATSRGRYSLDQTIQHTQLEGCFDATRCGDETAAKPDPQMLIEILDELMIAPSDALMIGDSQEDMQMASSTGMDCIGVSYSGTDPSSLIQYHPIAVINDILDVIDHLNP